MAIANGILKTTNSSLDLKSIMYAEIHLHKKDGVIVSSDILAKAMGITTSFRDIIDMADIELLEEYFINNDVNYFIIDNN